MPSSRWSSALLVMLLSIATLAAVKDGALAQAPRNSYTIGGVDVDASGTDAIQARQQGIRQAPPQTVKLLIERMVAPEDRSRVPPLDPSRLDGMIRGVEF